MKTNKVIVAPYDETWPKEFDKSKRELVEALGSLAKRVEL